MKEFKDKVAVVTGAASGIGRAMAERFAAEGMKVVLADIEEQALRSTEQDMRAAGATVLAVKTDTSQPSDLEALAEKSVDTFGAVHVLCNNAGVAPPLGPMWERSLEDWEWVFGVNFWGVIHGLRSFLPIMMEQDTEGHIVNTASAAGITSGPGLAIYYATKHAVVAVTESLHHELAMAGSKLNASVLCPGMVRTKILESDRNRPADTQTESDSVSPMSEAIERAAQEAMKTGMSPQEVAEAVFDAIQNEKFYIITHPHTKENVRTRMQDMIEGRNPNFAPAS